MLRPASALVGLTLLATASVVGLPVTGASATPRPVEPVVSQVALTGVDGAALRRLAGPLSRRPLVLTAERGTRSFSTVGVTWRHDEAVDDVAVQVRWRTRGAWSAWRALEVDADHAPDPGSVEDTAAVRDGTAPLWVGASDGVQVRLDRRSGARPVDVRLELVDPGASPADAPARPRRSAASAEELQPEVVTRAQWGADESIRRGTPTYTSPARVGFVHHTATAGSYSPAQAAAMVRSVYAFHVRSRGWSDVGYNILVDRYGRVYEGRAGGIDRWVLGTHTGGHNSASFAVSLLGSFDRVAPPAVALEALERTMAWKLGLAYRDPATTTTLTSAGGGTSRYAAGTTNDFRVVSGHRDAGTTACPGAATYARIGEIRAAVRSHLGAAFVEPRLGGGGAVPWRVTTRTLGGRMDWALDVLRGGQVVRTVTGAADGSLTASWDGRLAGGAPAPAGSYVLRLRGAVGDDTARPWTAGVALVGTARDRWRLPTRG